MRSELNLSHTIPGDYGEHFRLGHREMISFAQVQLKKLSNPLIAFYWIANFCALLSIVWVIMKHPVSLPKAAGFSLLGILFFFLLIPLHEGIHGLAYKLCGATSVSYHADPRKMVFYALADRFVIGYRKFLFVAFAPFVIITSLLLVLLFTSGSAWTWFTYGALLMHTSGCAGDFALAGYFYEHRRQDPLTYDLKDEGITIFLLRKATE